MMIQVILKILNQFLEYVNKTVTAILGECGDLRRFESAKSFIGFLGLYPTLYQSGKSLSTGTLAKKRNTNSKVCSFIWQQYQLLEHNNELHKLFRDKASSGKSKKRSIDNYC